MKSKLSSRKFWLTVVAVIYTIVATMGMEMPIDQVALTDAVIAVFVVVEGLIDFKKKK